MRPGGAGRRQPGRRRQPGPLGNGACTVLGGADGRYICPPSTVFPSFNACGSGGIDTSGTVAAKHIEVYRFNNHEGGQEHHWIRQLVFLRRILG
jgi:hypothetical protein